MDKRKTASPLVRFAALLIVLALAAILPFGIVAASAGIIPPQYEKTYYAALELKYDRLRSVEGPRVVVIGGSSAAFGIDSKIIEKELGMPCVNFGLYAAFGLKCMLDLSLNGLNKGDIVIITPEYSTQMYSDYIGYSYLLQAWDSRPFVLLGLGRDYYPGLLEALPAHLAEKANFGKNGSPVPQGVYSISAFDEYGDIVYDRSSNTMDGMYSADNLPEISPELVTNSFADMINEYTAAAKKKGAQVWFGFCPVNELAVEQAQGIDKEGFIEALSQKLDCPIISSLDDHIMDAGYFYDSNFHMNNAGMVYNTVLLVNDIKRVRGEMTVTNTVLPNPLGGGASAEVLSSGVFEGLKYNVTPQGVAITGLDETGLTAQSIVVPESIEGLLVYKIEANAFQNCSASVIDLPTGVTVLSASPFKDAKNLTSVYLRSEKLPSVGDSLMNGAPDGAIIYVPSELYGDYVTDYFWANYAGVIEKMP